VENLFPPIPSELILPPTDFSWAEVSPAFRSFASDALLPEFEAWCRSRRRRREACAASLSTPRLGSAVWNAALIGIIYPLVNNWADAQSYTRYFEYGAFAFRPAA
jgi:hypothetical protein